MNLNQYQKEALKTAIYPTYQKDNGWVYPALGLAGECGEIINKLKKLIRDKTTIKEYEVRHELYFELGDLMWYFVVLCHELKIDPDKVLEFNIKKLRKRKETKTISGSGDHREVPLGL